MATLHARAPPSGKVSSGAGTKPPSSPAFFSSMGESRELSACSWPACVLSGGAAGCSWTGDAICDVFFTRDRKLLTLRRIRSLLGHNEEEKHQTLIVKG